MWVWLVLLYGLIKGIREVCKKKALLTSSSIEVLLIYTVVAFIMVCPDYKNAMGMEPKYYLLVAVKSFVIFIAWICSFKAIKYLPLSLYGVLDLSRVLFATLLGVTVLHEKMGLFNILGLILVCIGLFMLRYNPINIFAKNKLSKFSTFSEGPSFKSSDLSNINNNPNAFSQSRSFLIIIIALLSCLLNAVSGLMDKILMSDITSSQLQFWYMLFLSIMYILYAIFSRKEVHILAALKNKWIWLLSILFVIADRALFIANSYSNSQVTVMTLLKQIGCIVTILAGKYIFKEKNTGYKLLCASVVIIGIVLSVV